MFSQGVGISSFRSFFYSISVCWKLKIESCRLFYIISHNQGFFGKGGTTRLVYSLATAAGVKGMAYQQGPKVKVEDLRFSLLV